MKKIWMIEQQTRVMNTVEWSEPIPMYAYSNKESAENDINYKKGIENDGYLEYSHTITEYDLYDE